MKNILREALRAVPAYDICTMAWLCKGHIDRYEAQNWQADHCPLEPDSTFVDELGRLDHFLLLLQFGACVEHVLERPFPPRSWANIHRRR